MRRPLVAATAVGAALALGAFLMMLGRGQAAPAALATYVGGDACARCHQAESQLWAQSHHDLAMQEATEATVLGDFLGATYTHRGVTSVFTSRDGAFYVTTEGPTGEMAEYPIEYTFGVTPLQQYLIPFPGGRYQVLGIAWDARAANEGGQRWFHLYPDDDTGPTSALHWTRPSQNWNTTCAECHSTNLQKGFDVALLSFETTWSEVDVSCEACHGPGSGHVSVADAWTATGRDEAPEDWALQVALGDPQRAWAPAPGAHTATRVEPLASRTEVEACAHCHARRAIIAEERGPGETLLDTDLVSLLRQDLYHADGQILEEVYVYGSFVQSKMYAAGVTCTDCHDPHSLQLRAEGNALCTRCHNATVFDEQSHHFHQTSSQGAKCVECHMPATTYMGVDSRRDHGLRIPRPDLSVAVGVPNACSRCHDDQSSAWAAQTTERWYGPPKDTPHFSLAIHEGRRGNPAAVPELAAVANDPTRPAIIRATALSLLVGVPRTEAVTVIRASLVDPESMVRLGALEALVGLPPSTVLPLAYPLLGDPVRAVRIGAARLLAAVPAALATAEQAAVIARRTAEFEESQRVNAEHPSSWVNLGDLYVAQGRVEDGEAAYRTALALDSMDLVAYLNLADLQRALGRDDVGEAVLGRALVMRPGAAEVLHALGLLKVRQSDTPAALELLERAVQAQPGNARFGYVLGVALWSDGRIAPAMEALAAAFKVNPFDRELLSALASYAGELDDVGLAITYAERLVEATPEDAAARQMLAGLRRPGR